LASILLDVAVGGDVVQDPAQVIFTISKNPYSTKPMVFERNTRLRLKLGWNVHNFFNFGVTTLLPVAKRIIYAFLDHP
jgi:hypothetical protein